MAEKTQDQAAQEGQVKVGGETLTLRFGWGAFTRIADALGCTVDNIEARIRALKMSDLNVVLWGGCMTHHPEMTLEDIAALLDKGDMAEAQAAVQKASALFGAAMPKTAGKAAGGGGEADPPKAAA